MLRRAAPLVRNLRPTPLTQSSTSASRAENVARTSSERNLEGLRGRYQENSFKNDFKPRYSNSVETNQLMRKHQDTIQNAGLTSLSDAIERINWYAAVSAATLAKISEIMGKASIEELNAMSDRSIASLFSSFGEICKEKKREDKREMLESTVKGITEKGYSLGPLTRASIFTAKVDIATRVEELPKIIDELTVWESDGLALNDEMLVQAARVYAMKGDRKGVIELTNYSRELLGRVDGRFVEWLAFSMISCGEGNGVATIEKLSRSAPSSAGRLWLSGALAAATKRDVSIVLECLSRVPLSLSLQNWGCNGPVVDILVTLIERGIEGAEQSLRPFLALSDDGLSLHERHGSNGSLVFMARRAVSEGNIDAATRLYALSHQSHRQKYVGFDLRRGVGEMARKGENSIEEVTKYAVRLQECQIIEDANSYLLRELKGDKLIELITNLRKTGQLSEAIKKSGVNTFALVSQLIKSGSSPLLVTPSVAALLYYTPFSKEERIDAETWLFKAARKDPDVVVRVIKELAETGMEDCEVKKSLAGLVVNSALSCILMETDVLTSGRIEEIIASKDVPWIRLLSMERKLIRLFTKAKDEETKEKTVEIVTKMIIASFKSGVFKNEKGREDKKSQIIINLVGHTTITDNHVERMVEKLAGEPSVGIGNSEMEKAQEELRKRGLEKRAELLGRMKKSQTYRRWLASSADDLEVELKKREGKKGVDVNKLISLRSLLMNKLMEEAPLSTVKVVPILEKLIPTLEAVNEMKEKDEDLDPTNGTKERFNRTGYRNSMEKLLEKTMKECAMEGDWSAAERLWKARGSLSTVPVAPSLALSYHHLKGGDEQLSKDIITTILSNGQTVGKVQLNDVGEIFGHLPAEELNAIEEWLKKELRLEANDVARIKTASVKRNIREQISDGDIKSAFELMKKASENAKIATGHVEVMQAAIRENNRAIIDNTVAVVTRLHSHQAAILDLAYSCLLEDKSDVAKSLFEKANAKLSPLKISFFVKHALELNRVDVIHSLFSIFVSLPLSNEKASSSDLNNIAFAALKGYEKANDRDAMNGLMKEIEGQRSPQVRFVPFVIESRLREFMDRLKESKGSSGSSV